MVRIISPRANEGGYFSPSQPLKLNFSPSLHLNFSQIILMKPLNFIQLSLSKFNFILLSGKSAVGQIVTRPALRQVY